LSEAACPDPSGKSRELCDSGNEQQIERSCLPRPIGEIPPQRNNEQRTTNNEQRTTNNEQRTIKELERSCLPRPIGEIPPQRNNEQRTTNNEQRTTNKQRAVGSDADDRSFFYKLFSPFLFSFLKKIHTFGGSSLWFAFANSNVCLKLILHNE
jgi:hypothetical protein